MLRERVRRPGTEDRERHSPLFSLHFASLIRRVHWRAPSICKPLPFRDFHRHQLLIQLNISFFLVIAQFEATNFLPSSLRCCCFSSDIFPWRKRPPQPRRLWKTKETCNLRPLITSRPRLFTLRPSNWTLTMRLSTGTIRRAHPCKDLLRSSWLRFNVEILLYYVAFTWSERASWFFWKCSNRSAAFLNLVKLTKALADAEMTIKLKPDWEKVLLLLQFRKLLYFSLV